MTCLFPLRFSLNASSPLRVVPKGVRNLIWNLMPICCSGDVHNVMYSYLSPSNFRPSNSRQLCYWWYLRRRNHDKHLWCLFFLQIYLSVRNTSWTWDKSGVVASKYSQNHFISEKYKTLKWFKLQPFKMFPSRIYTLLSGTVKLLETFAEIILWKPFQFFRRILNDVGRITKAPYFSADVFDETGKNQLEPGQKGMGDAAVWSHCTLLRNPWPKQTAVLEHYRKGETNLVCPFFGMFQSDRTP